MVSVCCEIPSRKDPLESRNQARRTGPTSLRIIRRRILQGEFRQLAVGNGTLRKYPLRLIGELGRH